MTAKPNTHCLSISQNDFGQLSNGKNVQLFTLSNIQGTAVKITNYGGIIVALNTLDKHGMSADIVLGSVPLLVVMLGGLIRGYCQLMVKTIN